MKKFLVFLLGTVLAVGLTACGSEPAAEETPAEPATVSDSVKDDTAEEGTGTTGNYTVAIKNAQVVANSFDGSNMLVVTYDFTNNAEEPMSPMVGISAQAYQDGVQLESAADYGNPEVGELFEQSDNNVQQGTTIEAVCAFTLGESTSPVEVTLADWTSFDGGDPISKTFDLSALQ